MHSRLATLTPGGHDESLGGQQERGVRGPGSGVGASGPEALRREPRGFYAVFDAFAGRLLPQSYSVLAPGGILVSYGFSPTLASTLDEASAGHVNPRIHEVVPWAECLRAHQSIADGWVRGKILLKFR